MSLDTSIQRTVQKTLHQASETVTIRRITPGVYNTTTRTIGNGQTDQDVEMSITTFTDRETLASAGSIQSGDRKGLVAALDLDFDPLPKDQVLLGDAVYDVLSVDQETGLKSVAMYVLQLRR